MYVEDLKRGPNTEIGPKDFFEMASGIIECKAPRRIAGKSGRSSGPSPPMRSDRREPAGAACFGSRHPD